MGAKKQRIVDTSAQRASEILSKSIMRIPAMTFDKSVDIKAETDAAHGHITKIKLRFEFPGKPEMCIRMSFYDDDGRDCNMSIVCVYDDISVGMEHLSARNGDKYTKVAKTLGIPAPLDEAARMTEFCVALISPLFEECTLEDYIEPLDTVERDGIHYYTGYGGLMRALYPPHFCESGGFGVANEN